MVYDLAGSKRVALPVVGQPPSRGLHAVASLASQRLTRHYRAAQLSEFVRQASLRVGMDFSSMTALSPAPSLRERNRQRIRTAITRAAMESFAASGVSATTFDHIALKAGIARATVFKHFANKNAIVAAIVEQLDSELVQQIDRHAQRAVPVSIRITGFFAENGALLEARSQVIRPLLPILEQAWNEHPGEVRMQRLRAAFTALIAGPECRPDAEPVAEIVLGTYLVITHNWRVQEGYSVRDHMLTASELICRIVAEKG